LLSPIQLENSLKSDIELGTHKNISKKQQLGRDFFNYNKSKSRKYSWTPGKIMGETSSSSHPGTTFHKFCILLRAPKKFSKNCQGQVSGAILGRPHGDVYIDLGPGELGGHRTNS